MEDNKNFVIRCRGVIVHEGKLLVVTHAHDTSFCALPGGHLEWGEGVHECLRREIVEELGIEPMLGRLLFVNTFMDGENSQPFEFFIEITNGKDFFEAKSLIGTHAHELARIAWISKEDTATLLPKKFHEQFQKGALFSDEVRFL